MKLLERFKSLFQDGTSSGTTVKKILIADDIRRVLAIVDNHAGEIDGFILILSHQGQTETYASGVSGLEALGLVDKGHDQILHPNVKD